MSRQPEKEIAEEIKGLRKDMKLLSEPLIAIEQTLFEMVERIIVFVNFVMAKEEKHEKPNSKDT